MASQAESHSDKPRLAPGRLPRHIAIIMDGNGRWAEQRGRARWEGHAEGARSVREVVTSARESGIEALTLYAFSVQNWGRPTVEVERLMELLLDYLVEEERTIIDNGIRLMGIGQTDRLPKRVRARLGYLERISKDSRGMTLTLALSYGSREEIVSACQKVARDVAAGALAPEQIDERRLDDYMFTRGLPTLDLLIRTSGELRLSNFLLWQAAYAEIVVTEVLWPDFGEADFFACIEEYRARERRYGRTSAQLGERNRI